MLALLERHVDVRLIDLDVARDDGEQVGLQGLDDVRREREMVGEQDEPQALLGGLTRTARRGTNA